MAEIKLISYGDNPELYEQTLRKNLNTYHSKETLIEFAVEKAVDAERYFSQLSELQISYAKLLSEHNLAVNLMSGLRSKSIDEIANILEKHFDANYIANMLRKAKKSAFSHNKNIAKRPRKKLPTKQEIIDFRDNWISECVRNYGVEKEKGWRKEYKNKENISYTKINQILNSN